MFVCLLSSYATTQPTTHPGGGGGRDRQFILRQSLLAWKRGLNISMLYIMLIISYYLLKSIRNNYWVLLFVSQRCKSTNNVVT